MGKFIAVLGWMYIIALVVVFLLNILFMTIYIIDAEYARAVHHQIWAIVLMYILNDLRNDEEA